MADVAVAKASASTSGSAAGSSNEPENADRQRSESAEATVETGRFKPGGGVLTYLAERGCAALIVRFFTRNP